MRQAVGLLAARRDTQVGPSLLTFDAIAEAYGMEEVREAAADWYSLVVGTPSTRSTGRDGTA
ncbi:hypothetical protein GCM10023205_04160 [Yinghuangia aomiensis]|uniref:Uncharacterized protein n=1 Tax=Yinghuangia aomiensis TaxID=676205 RepID=A0ABP9GLZ6_9ACTN